MNILRFFKTSTSRDTAVSDDNPLPVSAPKGLSVLDTARTAAGAQTSLPLTYTVTHSDTVAPATKTMTLTSTVSGDSRSFVKTITYHASGEVNVISDWVQT